MNAKKLCVLISLLTVFVMLITSCAAPATPVPPTATQAPPTQAPPAATKPPAPTQPPVATVAPTQPPVPTTAPTQPPPPTTAPAAGPTPYPKVAGSIPYPPAALPVGQKQPKTYNLDEMIAYKKLSKYCEPDWVAKLVADGKLPPVEKRLPDEPQVILKSYMPDGIGEYGGAWNDFSGNPIDGWNWAAGQGSGWYGVNEVLEPGLIERGSMWLRKDKLEPLPSLAKSWEWSKDGYSLTMYLIKGAKWSDGVPFTADDVMFHWNDIINDPNVPNYARPAHFQLGGKDAKLEKVDDYTVKWTFAAPFATYELFNMGFGGNSVGFAVSPMHILKPLHPKYNPNTDYKAFTNALPPQALPVVTMGPWTPVSYKTDELLVMRRNPYYWKVDENGCQLPYIDEATWTKGVGATGRDQRFLSGAGVQTSVNALELQTQALKQAADPNFPGRFELGPEVNSFSLELNQSADLGVQGDRDTAMRALFRDVRFRRALSQAIDRDGMARALSEGGFARGFAGGIYPGSQFFDINSVVYYPYDVTASKSLLADLGFKDTDNNGILNWTSGPLSGQDLAINLTVFDSQTTSMLVSEALIPMFSKVGIKLNYKVLKQQQFNDEQASGVWDLHVQRGNQEYAVPNTRCRDIAPVTKVMPNWHREGTQPRKLQPFEEQMVALVNKFCVETDTAKQKELMSQYNRLFTENLYSLGVVVGSYPQGFSKALKNVPAGIPSSLYEYMHNNGFIEAFWFAKKDQPKEVMPGVIPVYAK